MVDTKVTTARLTITSDKFEILVKPDPALDYKLGKNIDLGSVLVAEEIYSDANKGSRASSEKLLKHFKTTDSTEIAKQILLKGDLSLTTDQRRRMIEEKRKQIVQYINKSFVDPKTHTPHPSNTNRVCNGRSKNNSGPFQTRRRSSQKCGRRDKKNIASEV